MALREKFLGREFPRERIIFPLQFNVAMNFPILLISIFLQCSNKQGYGIGKVHYSAIFIFMIS